MQLAWSLVNTVWRSCYKYGCSKLLVHFNYHAFLFFFLSIFRCRLLFGVDIKGHKKVLLKLVVCLFALFALFLVFLFLILIFLNLMHKNHASALCFFHLFQAIWLKHKEGPHLVVCLLAWPLLGYSLFFVCVFLSLYVEAMGSKFKIH